MKTPPPPLFRDKNRLFLIKWPLFLDEVIGGNLPFFFPPFHGDGNIFPSRGFLNVVFLQNFSTQQVRPFSFPPPFFLQTISEPLASPRMNRSFLASFLSLSGQDFPPFPFPFFSFPFFDLRSMPRGVFFSFPGARFVSGSHSFLSPPFSRVKVLNALLQPPLFSPPPFPLPKRWI